MTCWARRAARVRVALDLMGGDLDAVEFEWPPWGDEAKQPRLFVPSRGFVPYGPGEAVEVTEADLRGIAYVSP